MIELVIEYVLFKTKSFLSYLYYRKKTQIVFCDANFKIFDRYFNLKYLPKQGEMISLSNDDNYYTVLMVIHKLKPKNVIWVIVEPKVV